MEVDVGGGSCVSRTMKEEETRRRNEIFIVSSRLRNNSMGVGIVVGFCASTCKWYCCDNSKMRVDCC